MVRIERYRRVLTLPLRSKAREPRERLTRSPDPQSEPSCADTTVMDATKGSGLDCPNCSKRLRWALILFGKPFACPWCGSSLRPPRSFSTWLGLYNLCLTGVIAYGLGARGWVLAAAVPIGFFPVGLVLSLIAKRVLRPTLIFSDDYLDDIKNPQW